MRHVYLFATGCITESCLDLVGGGVTAASAIAPCVWVIPYQIPRGPVCLYTKYVFHKELELDKKALDYQEYLFFLCAFCPVWLPSMCYLWGAPID